MMLQFSPAELKRCNEALVRQAEAADPLTTVAESADVTGYLTSLTSWAWGGNEDATSGQAGSGRS
jgi:hypothetical protein